MKFSATFEEKVKKAEEQGDRPLVSSYLNPSKVDPKEPVSFALLEEDPLSFGKFTENQYTEKKVNPLDLSANQQKKKF